MFGSWLCKFGWEPVSLWAWDPPISCLYVNSRKQDMAYMIVPQTLLLVLLHARNSNHDLYVDHGTVARKCQSKSGYVISIF